MGSDRKYRDHFGHGDSVLYHSISLGFSLSIISQYESYKRQKRQLMIGALQKIYNDNEDIIWAFIDRLFVAIVFFLFGWIL